MNVLQSLDVVKQNQLKDVLSDTGSDYGDVLYYKQIRRLSWSDA
jgi:hypothetical protein